MTRTSADVELEIAKIARSDTPSITEIENLQAERSVLLQKEEQYRRTVGMPANATPGASPAGAD